VSDAWFYVEGEKRVGPVSLEDLKRLLSKMKDWRKKLVWNASFSEWREAGSVPEINIVEPPPVPKSTAQQKPKWWHRVARVLVWLAGVLVFLVVAAFVKVLVQQYLHRPSSMNVEEVLTLAENKAQVPQKLGDGVTTLVAVKHTGVKELTYFYSLDTQNYDIPPGFAVTLREEVAPQACIQMKEALSLGVTIWYRYRDDTGKEIGRFGINQGDCH
jgi:hypothetical protein